jgi:hypothetical protein
MGLSGKLTMKLSIRENHYSGIVNRVLLSLSLEFRSRFLAGTLLISG